MYDEAFLYLRLSMMRFHARKREVHRSTQGGTCRFYGSRGGAERGGRGRALGRSSPAAWRPRRRERPCPSQSTFTEKTAPQGAPHKELENHFQTGKRETPAYKSIQLF